MRKWLLAAAILLLSFLGHAQAPDSLQLTALDAKLEEFFAALATEPVAVKNAEADFLISSCTTDAVRDHVAIRIYDHFINSPLMGDEGVAVHLTDTWFAPGKTHFTNEIDLMNARIYAEFNRASLLGEKAPVLEVLDPSGRKVRVPGEDRLSILYLYDTDCAKCKLETTQLQRHFLTASRTYDVDFYAFYTGSNAEAWASYRPQLDLQGIQVFHVWDPELDSDFQRLYGVLQTPRMLLIDRNGLVIGRGLDTPGLVNLLSQVLREPEYGSMQDFYESLFSALEPDVTLEDIRTVGARIVSLAEEDPLLYKQMTGDLLMYLSGQRGAAYKEGLAYVADSLVRGRPSLWTTENDRLQVLALADWMKELYDRAPVGSRLARIKVPGTLVTAKKTRQVRRSLRCLRGPAYIGFLTEGCSICEAEQAAAKTVLAAEPKAKIFWIDMDRLMAEQPDLAERLLDTFDLSSLPYILKTDRKGRITGRYLSLQQ